MWRRQYQSHQKLVSNLRRKEPNVNPFSRLIASVGVVLPSPLSLVAPFIMESQAYPRSRVDPRQQQPSAPMGGGYGGGAGYGGGGYNNGMGAGAPPGGMGSGAMAPGAAGPGGPTMGLGMGPAPSSSSGLDMNSMLARARKFKKDASPYLPTLVRVLLIATFVEDGVRVLFELPHQVDFLRLQYRMPSFIATILLVGNVLISFLGCGLVVAQKKIARGAYETHGSYLLLACVLYQQIMYGRHSPIGSGNWGFLVRNLCLAGSLLLISCQVRLAAGQSALPMGLLDGQSSNKKQTVAYMQAGSRFLLVLLAMEFVATLGWIGTILTMPVILAVLVGFQLEISGAILLTLYFVHNVLNSSFWSVNGTYMREIMRYEFVQTLSIMGGLILMISVGPGAISVDEMRGRKAF